MEVNAPVTTTLENKTPREISCDHCNSFQRLGVDNGNLVCGRCNSVIARRNAEGLLYCKECMEYQQFFEQPPHPMLARDQRNQGYVLGDIVCSCCHFIIAVVREPAAREGC